MSLPPDTRFGPYRVVAKLGEGGMGEVYRAKDTQLDRDVAIKVLPASFALDTDRVARFTREAKTLATLNHPNIAAIYGLESSGSGPGSALVMELVEGDDLSTIIARGPLPLAEALPIARQIADALEAAHEQGVIHRDLKPANIKVRADGTVKVLDFGLAKALDADAASATADAMNSPTLTAAGFAQGYGGPGTQMGMIIGTAAYMAPEQAKGRAVDRRADIWAFGVVLYEMLTGQRAFKGDDISETLASVLKDTLAIDALPAGTPSRLRDLVARCLQKDPRQRQRDIGDVKLELDAIAAGGSDATPVPGAARTRTRPSLALVAAIVLVAAAIGVAIGWGLTRNSVAPAGATTRFIVDSPPGPDPQGPLLTPDGRVLIFATDRLYRRDLGAFQATPMPGTEGATTPMISPDGRWVAFFANGKIKKVSLSGGDPTTIAEVNGAIPGAVWGPDNTDPLFTSLGHGNLLDPGGRRPDSPTDRAGSHARRTRSLATARAPWRAADPVYDLDVWLGRQRRAHRSARSEDPRASRPVSRFGRLLPSVGTHLVFPRGRLARRSVRCRVRKNDRRSGNRPRRRAGGVA